MTSYLPSTSLTRHSTALNGIVAAQCDLLPVETTLTTEMSTRRPCGGSGQSWNSDSTNKMMRGLYSSEFSLLAASIAVKIVFNGTGLVVPARSIGTTSFLPLVNFETTFGDSFLHSSFPLSCKFFESCFSEEFLLFRFLHVPTTLSIRPLFIFLVFGTGEHFSVAFVLFSLVQHCFLYVSKLVRVEIPLLPFHRVNARES